MNLKPEEISSVIKEQMKRYAAQLQVAVYMDWKMPCRENF